MVTLFSCLSLLLLSTGAMSAARTLRTSKRGWWIIGILAPAIVLLLVIGGRRVPRLAFTPPFSWAVDADLAPYLMAVVIPLLLTTMLQRLLHRRQRVAVALFMVLITCVYALLPVLLPPMVRSTLLATPTRLDPHGVCLQTHSYTCGPASAVTCLRSLSIPADEGPLAVAAQCAPVEGADGHRLARAINELSRPRGLTCRFTFLATLDQLTTPAIATIFSPRYRNHYVAVLEVTSSEVIVSDPLSGRDRYSRDEFLAQWTGATHLFSPIDSAPLPPAAAPPTTSPGHPPRKPACSLPAS